MRKLTVEKVLDNRACNYIFCSKSLILSLFLICSLPTLYSQDDCELNDALGEITSITGATIDISTSTITSVSPNGDENEGSSLEITATGCGEITMEITLSYDWVQGSSDDAWIHGVSFSSSGGWSSGSVGALGTGWEYYGSVTGDCSGNTYTDGYFYDDCDVGADFESSCSCWDWFWGDIECDFCDSPNDNWGINCEGSDCPDFSFELTYCPDEAGTQTEEITFFLTNDGESGSWDDAIGCFYKITYPITINAAGVQVPEDAFMGCPGECYTLDAGTGCDGYLWTTGETTSTIEVCPTEDTDYTVTVDIACGDEISGTYSVDVEPCCEAEAGDISGTPDPACPGEVITGTIVNFNDTAPYTEVYIVVGPDGTIVETGPIDGAGQFTFTADECGTFTFISYNYLTDGSASIPMVGDVYSSLSCDIDIDCCDAEELTLTVEDTTPPDIVLPPAPTPTCYQDYLDNTTIDDATWTDNCDAVGGSIPGTETTASVPTICDGGTISFEYTITDQCDNTATETLNIIIPPLEPSSWDEPLPEDNIDVICGDPIPDAPGLTFSNGIADPCSIIGGPVSPALSGDNPPMTCGDILIRTWSGVTDDCGNILPDFIQTITITDLVLPTFDNPPTAISDINCDDAFPDQELLSGIDNCGNVVITPSSSFTEDICNGYPVTYEWLIEDECGNSDMTSVVFNVLPDSEAPVFDNPPLPIADILCTESFPVQEVLTGTDDCSNVTITMNQDFTEDLCNGYQVTYEWLIEDDCGNMDMTTVVFNVLPDTSFPTFDNPPMPVADVLCGEPIPVQETLTGSDDCGNVTITPTETFTEDICNGYTITHEWLIEDDCGNSDMVSIMFNVLGDAGPPTFDNLPAPIADVLCGEPIPVQETLIGSDDCGNVTITPTETFTEDICNGYTITHEWLIEDDCGNSDMVSIMFNVLGDAGPPTFDNLPAPIADVLCGEPIPVQEILTGSDDCGNVTITPTETFTEDICNGYTITHEWLIEDDCGNSDMVSIMFDVLGDAGAPVFDNPPTPIPDQNCGDALPPFEDLTATDDCGIVTVIPTMDLPVEDICEGYMINYIWTASDECGNEEMVSTSFNVLPDLEPPVLTIPEDMMESCESIPPIGAVSVVDNCSSVTDITINYIGEVILENGLCDIQIERTWEAIDLCGNSVTETQVIDIIKPDPVWTSSLPSNLNLVCGQDTEPIYEDLNYSNSSMEIFCIEEGSIPPIEEGSLINCGDSKTVTWQYDTDCGEMLFHQITLTLVDFENPEWVSLPNTTENVTCVNEIPTVEDLEVMDNCNDNTFVSFVDIGSVDPCIGGSLIRSWMYTDDCGNGPISTSKIYVVEAPSFTTCDDGDPCTENDEGVIDCLGNICSCEGTQKPGISILGSLSICTGSSTVLSTDGVGTYLWSTGGTAPTITVTTAGMYSVTVTDSDGCERDASVDVIIDDVLNPTISGELGVCEGGMTTLDVGSTFATYIWSTGEITSTIDVGIGTYSVTVTDLTGCIGENEVTVIEYPPFEISIIGCGDICAGGTVTLSGEPGYTYEWSNGLTNQNITVNESGTYSLTVTDSEGCFSSTECTIEVGTTLDVEITGNDQICEMSTTVLDAGDWETYIWSTGGNAQTITVSEAGVYTVTVTDDTGCEGVGSISVNTINNPTPIIVGSTSFCEGGFSVLELFDDYVSYQWNDDLNSTTSSITVTEEATYSVIVIDENGCEGFAEIIVTLETDLQPNISGELNICQGETTILDAGSGFADYEWSTGETTTFIEVTAGEYSVTVMDISGCSGSDTVEVLTVEALPIEIAGVLTICEGTTTTLTASSGFASYVWSTGEIGPIIEVVDQGSYSVIGLSSNGCESTNDVFVEIIETLSFEISGDTTLCVLESTVLDAGIWDSYLWNNGAITQTITVTEAGIYSVVIMDTNGCSAFDEIEVNVYESPDPQITGSTTFCIGGSSVLGLANTYISYQWNDDANSTTETITVTDEGTFMVTVVDENGCIGQTSIVVTIEEDLMPQITGSLAFCDGDSTILDAGNGFMIYQWSTGSGDQSIVVYEAGIYSVTVTDASGICTGDIEVTVSLFDNPNVEIMGDNLLCEDEQSILSTNTLFESYEWSTTENTSTIEVLGGQYGVTVSDENNCIDSAEITVVLNDDPTIIIESIECDDEGESYSVFFTADGDNITNSEGITDIDFVNGFYEIRDIDLGSSITVFVENSDSGCSSSIEALPPNCDCTAEADAGDDLMINCEITSVMIGGGNTSFGTDYTIEWVNEIGDIVSTDPTFITSDGGIYTLVVTDLIQDCIDQDVVVVQDITNAPEAVIYADPGNILDCSIDLINLSNAFTEDGVLNIWVIGADTTIANSISIDDGSDLMITLIALDTITQCMSTDNIVIENLTEYPIVDIQSPDTLNCAVDFIIIDGSNSQSGINIVYQWLDLNGNPISGETSTLFQQDEAGIYLLQAIDTTNGCTNIDTIEVFQNINQPFVDAGEDIILPCGESLAFLDASGTQNTSMITFEWSTTSGSFVDGLETLTPTVNAAGWYYIEIVDASNGCLAIDSVFVDLNNNIPAGFNQVNGPPNCFNGNDGFINLVVNSGGTAPFTYTLDGISNNTGNFENLMSGSYLINVIDDLGCGLDTTITLSNPDSIFVQNLELSHLIAVGESITVNLNTNVMPENIADITWTPPLNEPCNNCLEVELGNINSNQTYTITLTDIFGCMDTTSLLIEVFEIEIDIFIPNVLSVIADSPNNSFFPQSDENRLVDVMEIYDRWGELVFINDNFLMNDPTEGWNGNYKGEKAVAGVYVYKIVSEGKTLVGDVTLL